MFAKIHHYYKHCITIEFLRFQTFANIRHKIPVYSTLEGNLLFQHGEGNSRLASLSPHSTLLAPLPLLPVESPCLHRSTLCTLWPFHCHLRSSIRIVGHRVLGPLCSLYVLLLSAQMNHIHVLLVFPMLLESVDTTDFQWPSSMASRRGLKAQRKT